MKKEIFDKKAVKIPKKVTVNLAMKEKKTASVYTLTVGAVLIMALTFCVAKFGVVDQYSRLDKAESAYNSTHTQYLQTIDEAATYDAVTAEYRTYSRDWLINDDTGKFVSVDRTDVLNLVENDLMSKGQVGSVTIYGGQAVVEMSGMTLKEISEMLETVESEPIVAKAILNIASTEQQQSTASILDFSITIILQKAEEAVSQ